MAAGPLAGAGPMWLADNRTLFVFSVEAERGGWAIHRLDTTTGSSTLVRHFTALPRGVAVSPDGRALFYSVYEILEEQVESSGSIWPQGRNLNCEVARSSFPWRSRRTASSSLIWDLMVARVSATSP